MKSLMSFGVLILTALPSIASAPIAPARAKHGPMPAVGITVGIGPNRVLNFVPNRVPANGQLLFVPMGANPAPQPKTLASLIRDRIQTLSDSPITKIVLGLLAPNVSVYNKTFTASQSFPEPAFRLPDKLNYSDAASNLLQPKK